MTYESQYDRQRGTVTLAAETDRGDRYVVTVPASSQEDATDKARSFRRMYTDLEEATM